jgi:uncharacterized membrane protein
MKSLAVRSWVALVALLTFMAPLLFLPAGTLRYWQAWVYLLVFGVASALTTVDLLKRISTGPYAIVRHPMYASALLYLLGTPLALGSYWGLLAFFAMLPFLVWRLLNEERLRARAAGIRGVSAARATSSGASHLVAWDRARHDRRFDECAAGCTIVELFVKPAVNGTRLALS